MNGVSRMGYVILEHTPFDRQINAPGVYNSRRRLTTLYRENRMSS